MAIAHDFELDVRGEACPYPLIRTKQQIDRLQKGEVLNALQKAFRTRNADDLKGLVHHSYQGVQYTFREYVDCLKEHGILVSMSRTGNPYDNAFAESFIKNLKC